MTPVYKFSAAGSLTTSRTQYKSMLAGNSVYSPGAFDSIATVVVGAGGASSVEFTGIAGTYNHLQVRALVKTNRSTYNVDEMYMQFNSDATASNYYGHYLYAYNNNFPGTVLAGAAVNSFGPMFVGANNGSAPYAAYVIDVLDYANTNKFKTMRAIGGADSNGDVSGFCTVPMLVSQVWKSTNAITSIKIVPGIAPTFSQYSHFALYGIEGAA